MINTIFSLIGGLGFFFLGMKTIADGLKKSAGEKLKQFLHSVTKQPLIGILVGTFVTTLIQSSSATTVMVVGFVNAGLLALRQAISVIIGANIGTTFTAWLVSAMSIFKITTYALPSVGIGFGFMMLARSRNKTSFGEALLGFGLLFMGLDFMQHAFGPLKESPFIHNLFISFGKNPILGVFIGAFFTMLLQSSSVTTAILQILAFQGLISFHESIPLILGFNIGTTITAQLAAIGTNINARRAAMSHTLFNAIGVVFMIIFVYLGWFEKFIDWILPGEITTKNIMLYIAVTHTTFNVINAIIFLPLIGFLEKASIFLVPKKEGSIDYGTQYLEKHLLETPSLALEQTHKEIIYMLKIATKAVSHAMEGFFKNDMNISKQANEYENVTDNLQSEITQYMISLSQKELLPEESQELPVLMHNVNDLERIGDHAQNLAELTRRKIEEKFIFSDQAIKELNTMWAEIQKMLDLSLKALTENSIQTAEEVLEREGRINAMQIQFKQEHITRLKTGCCQINSGFLFIEMVDNLEKIGDRLKNIAQSVIGKMQWAIIKPAKTI